MSFNIFSAIFGDPAQQQAAIDKQFNVAMAKLKAARVSGNKPAELAALAEMRKLSAQGSASARRALDVVHAGNAIGSAAGSVTGAVGRILTSTPVILAGALVAGFLLLAKK